MFQFDRPFLRYGRDVSFITIRVMFQDDEKRYREKDYRYRSQIVTIGRNAFQLAFQLPSLKRKHPDST